MFATDTLMALESQSAEYHRRRGVAYYKLGEYHAAIARSSDPTPSEAERRESWNQARTWFSDCLGHFLDMRERGLMTASDLEAGVIEDIEFQVRTCDEALAALAVTNQGG